MTDSERVLIEQLLAFAFEFAFDFKNPGLDFFKFDLQTWIRVTDPFWGAKLIEKVAENILSALTNPEEAIFKTPGN